MTSPWALRHLVEPAMKVPLLALSLVLAPPALVRAVEAKPKADVPLPAPAEHFLLSDLLPRSLQKNPRLNLSIVTEITKAGRLIPAPTKEKPAYYVIQDGGMLAEGDVVAGERPPPPAKLALIMKSSLAASGYLPADEKNPPTLLIYYRWGSFNRLSPMDEEGATEDQVRQNVMMRASLVGGVKFGIDLIHAMDSHNMNFFRMHDENESLVTLAASDLYCLMAGAYDYESANKNVKKILWSTKISTDSQGLTMDDTLPTILASAKTYFGHETNGAVLFHPRLFEGKVEVGEPTVVRDPPPPQPTRPANKR